MARKKQEGKPKVASIFDFLNALTKEKRDWDSFSEMDKKAFSPWMINRWLSMRMEYVEVVDYLQKYTIGLLEPREVYNLYKDVLPNAPFFAKYIKSKSEEKYDKELLQVLSKHFELSFDEVREYIPLMGKDGVESVLVKYGYSEKEKKKLLKNV